MALGSNIDVVTLEAQALGFDATGKKINKIEDELVKLLSTMGAVQKIDIFRELTKSGNAAAGTLKLQAQLLDQFGNKINVISERVGEAGDKYKIFASDITRSNRAISESEKKAAQDATNARNRRIESVNRAIQASKDEMKQIEEVSRAATRKAKQGDVSDINRQLGGFKGGMTNAGVLAIDRANKNLLDLLSKSNVSTPRLNQIFTANQKNDRGVLDGLTEGEQKVSIALRRLSAAFDQASNAGQRTQNVLIGFRGMMRLIEVQQLHSVISGITTYFEQASQKSIELTGHIAAIQTISQKAQRSTEDWRDALISLSNAYGFDVIDIAKAGYEAISNQIAKGAAVTPFLAQAFEFARATASTAAESVDLLSSALNGYGLSTESVQKVSAILFKTIDLGRVKASELANTLGNSTPIASALGISLEELMAGISTLTIQGIKNDTALTLMNNIMLKLMKPTKGMSELFDQWGVASGEAAIKAFGFIGVLERLNSEFQKGGISKLAADAGDMRAIRALAGLLANGAIEKYRDNLAQISKGQQEFTNAVDLTANAMQTKLSKEFQKLNNLFIGSIGFKKNDLFLSAINQIGGLDKAIDGFAHALLSSTEILIQMAIPLVNLNTGLEQVNFGASKLTPTLITAGTAYLLMFRGGNILSMMLPLLNRGINNTTSVAHPAAVAITALGERMGLVNRHAFFGTMQFSALAGKIASFATVAIPALIGAYTYLSAIQDENERKRLSAGSDFLASITQADLDASKKLQESTEKLSSELTSGLSKNLKDLNLYWTVFQSRLNSFGEGALKSSSKFSIEDFENSLIGKNSVDRLGLLSNRFDELSTDMKNLFDARNFDGAGKALEKIVDVTKQFKEEQRKVTEEVKKTTEKLRESADDKAFEYKYYTKSDSRKMKVYGQRSASLQTEALAALNNSEFEKADKLIERAIEARQKSMSISESMVSSQGYGKPKGIAQFQDLIDTRIKIQEALGDAAKMGTKGDVMTDWSRGMDKLLNENIKTVSSLESKLQSATHTVEQLTSMMDKAASKLQSDKEGLRKNIGIFAAGLENVVQNTGGFTQPGHARDLLVYTYAEEKINLYGLIKAYEKLSTVKDDLQKSLLPGSTATEDEITKKFEAAKKQLEVVLELQVKIRNLAKGANEQRFFDLDVLTEQTVGKGINKKTALEILEETKRLGTQGAESQAGVNKQQGIITQFTGERDKALQELVQAKNELGDLFKDKLPETFKAATEAIKQAEDPMRAIQDSLKESLRGMREEADRLILKLKDLAPTPPVGNALGGSLTGASFGGAFAGGGFIDGPLGRDNLFIRAHAGEFVVNAEAAQKFYPQLTAMNSMYTATPNYNSGGPITQVGDIHINANLTGQTNVDVVALGKQLRREIKRGTVRLD